MGFKYYIKSRLMPFNQRHIVQRIIMGLRLHLIIICTSSLLEASTYGYRIPPQQCKPLPGCWSSSLWHVQHKFASKYPKDLATFLQEIVRLDMLSQEQKNNNWRKLVSIVKLFHMKFLASYDFRPILQLVIPKFKTTEQPII